MAAKKKHKYTWVDVTAVVLTILSMLILMMQAVTALVGKTPQMAENYYGQPVGPVLQLACVGAMIACFVLWLVFRKRPRSKQRRRQSSYKPPIPGQVPDRWPWE